MRGDEEARKRKNAETDAAFQARQILLKEQEEAREAEKDLTQRNTQPSNTHKRNTNVWPMYTSVSLSLSLYIYIYIYIYTYIFICAYFSLYVMYLLFE